MTPEIAKLLLQFIGPGRIKLDPSEINAYLACSQSLQIIVVGGEVAEDTETPPPAPEQDKAETDKKDSDDG